MTTWIRRLRGAQPAELSVDMRHAAAEFRSERYLLVEGEEPADPWDRIAGTYQCGDGKWLRRHSNFPHHRDGVLSLLGCAHRREAVQAAGALGWGQLDAYVDAGLFGAVGS